MKIFISLLVGLLLSVATLFVYWCGGGDFVRGDALGKIVFLSLLLFASGCVMTFICPVWDATNPTF